MDQTKNGRLWAFVSIFSCLIIWEVSVRLLGIPSYLLPPITDIIVRVFDNLSILLNASAMTLSEALSGFIIGATAGLTLAILINFTRSIRQPLMSVIVAINTVPMAAYAPLVILWFGIGMQSKIVIVAFEVGFTVLLGALSGLAQTERASINLLRSFGASPWTILWRLRLPNALPSIMTSLRLSTVRSIIATIVVEMLGSYQGLGWTLYQSVVMSDFLNVWSAILLASIISLVFFGLISWIERRVVFWQ